MFPDDYTTALFASLAKAQLQPGPLSSLIPSSFTATTGLAVQFGTKSIELGTFIRAAERKQAPSVSFNPEMIVDVDLSEAFYTLILRRSDSQTIHSLLSGGIGY
jgi:hypothetical protein